MKQRLTDNTGITLIALVITIIVLLILAGISIGALTGEDGIIGNAKNAKEETEIANEKEIIDKAVIMAMGENSRGNLVGEEFQNKLDKETGKGKTEVIDAGEEFGVTFIESNRHYVVDKDGNISLFEPIKDETPWELAGSGTKEDPYLIESVEDLVTFSNDVNQGNSYKTKYVKLVNTLNFNSPFSYNNPETKVIKDENENIVINNENGVKIINYLKEYGFNPIGKGGWNGVGFEGFFFGNQKEIRNIFINSKKRSVGLFAKIEGTNSGIKDLGVKITILIDKTNTNDTDNLGGITGELKSYAKIENCFADIDIIIENETRREGITIGGLVGTGSGIPQIRNSYTKGVINLEKEIQNENSANGLNLGGIIGHTQSIVIENCYNFASFNIEEVTGNLEVGGIVGRNDSVNATYKNCYNLSNIKNNERDAYLGGVCGYILETDTKIENCYNIGKTLNDYEYRKTGGIIGYCHQDYMFDINNYKENFYIKQYADLGIGNGEEMELLDKKGHIEALEESQMPKVIDVIQNQIEVDGQMINVWKEDTNNINNGYPILYWQ